MQLRQSYQPQPQQQQPLQIDQVTFYSPQIPNRLPNVPDVNELNEVAKQMRQQLSEQKYVTWKEIIFNLLIKYNSRHIGDLGKC
jgi:hypothetical protein